MYSTAHVYNVRVEEKVKFTDFHSFIFSASEMKINFILLFAMGKFPYLFGAIWYLKLKKRRKVMLMNIIAVYSHQLHCCLLRMCRGSCILLKSIGEQLGEKQIKEQCTKQWIDWWWKRGRIYVRFTCAFNRKQKPIHWYKIISTE